MSQSDVIEGVETASNQVDLTQLKADYARLIEQQARIMELLGTKDANQLMHDLRNVLNERELLRALTNLQD